MLHFSILKNPAHAWCRQPKPGASFRSPSAEKSQEFVPEGLRLFYVWGMSAIEYYFSVPTAPSTIGVQQGI